MIKKETQASKLGTKELTIFQSKTSLKESLLVSVSVDL